MTDKKKVEKLDHRVNLRGFAPLTKTEQKATFDPEVRGLSVVEIDGRRWACDNYIVANPEHWRQLMHQAVSEITPGQYVGNPLALDPAREPAPVEKLWREHAPEKMTEPVPVVELDGFAVIRFNSNGARKRADEQPLALLARQGGIVGIDIRRLSILAGFTADKRAYSDCNLEGLEFFEAKNGSNHLGPLTVRRGDQLLGIIMPVRLP